MSDSRVTVHIDKLVLRGIEPGDKQAFVSGLKAELARVLGGPEVRDGMVRSRKTPVMRLGGIRMEPGLAGPRTLGRSVARAIGKGMKP
jgi:hypothetical protein